MVKFSSKKLQEIPYFWIVLAKNHNCINDKRSINYSPFLHMFDLQILSETDLEEACEQPLCVISVLPHILDCNAACRNEYLKTLQTMGDKYKQKMWG